jgi:hypothetical protein
MGGAADTGGSGGAPLPAPGAVFTKIPSMPSIGA